MYPASYRSEITNKSHAATIEPKHLDNCTIDAVRLEYKSEGSGRGGNRIP